MAAAADAAAAVLAAAKDKGEGRSRKAKLGAAVAEKPERPAEAKPDISVAQKRGATQHGSRKIEKPRNAAQPEAPLDFADDAPSLEAQLLSRSTYSLHIKAVDDSGVSLIWSFPPANPGDCSAWVSLAPAALVAEASARQKFKLITKNKMFGECKCVRPARARARGQPACAPCLCACGVVVVAALVL